jgi:hypothetical protein
MNKMSAYPQILEMHHAQIGRDASIVDLSGAAIALESDHDDLLPLGRLAVVGVRSAYGLDLTSESERARIRRDVTRTAQGLDISEDAE